MLAKVCNRPRKKVD